VKKRNHQGGIKRNSTNKWGEGLQSKKQKNFVPNQENSVGRLEAGSKKESLNVKGGPNSMLY